jgi:hypothetical protein
MKIYILTLAALTLSAPAFADWAQSESALKAASAKHNGAEAGCKSAMSSLKSGSPLAMAIAQTRVKQACDNRDAAKAELNKACESAALAAVGDAAHAKWVADTCGVDPSAMAKKAVEKEEDKLQSAAEAKLAPEEQKLIAEARFEWQKRETEMKQKAKDYIKSQAACDDASLDIGLLAMKTTADEQAKLDAAKKKSCDEKFAAETKIKANCASEDKLLEDEVNKKLKLIGLKLKIPDIEKHKAFVKQVCARLPQDQAR